MEKNNGPGPVSVERLERVAAGGSDPEILGAWKVEDDAPVADVPSLDEMTDLYRGMERQERRAHTVVAGEVFSGVTKGNLFTPDDPESVEAAVANAQEVAGSLTSTARSSVHRDRERS